MKSTMRQTTKKLQSVYEIERQRERKDTDRAKNTTFTEEIGQKLGAHLAEMNERLNGDIYLH